jgi:branched-subunit amino acid transport protein
MSKWMRQFHRWISIAFTLGVIANTVIIATGGGAQPASWVYLLALIPLFLLLITGLYLFALPYVAKGPRANG